jgi:hypothetical protein
VLRVFILSAVLTARTGDSLSTDYVRRFVSHAQATKVSELILVGTIENLGEVPRACLKAAPQFVTFRVDQVLWGTWQDSTIRVAYGNCSFQPLAEPPFTKGARVIVFATYTDDTFAYGSYGGNEHSARKLGVFPAVEDNVKTVAQYVRTLPGR